MQFFCKECGRIMTFLQDDDTWRCEKCYSLPSRRIEE